jgi:hypothetical protein
MLQEIISGEHTVKVVSILPSSYLLYLSSEIDVIDNKCSFRQGLVDQVLSRSYWKVQGHSEHRKKNQILTFLHLTAKDTDMRSLETYTKYYRQYM